MLQGEMNGGAGVGGAGDGDSNKLLPPLLPGRGGGGTKGTWEGLDDKVDGGGGGGGIGVEIVKLVAWPEWRGGGGGGGGPALIAPFSFIGGVGGGGGGVGGALSLMDGSSLKGAIGGGVGSPKGGVGGSGEVKGVPVVWGMLDDNWSFPPKWVLVSFINEGSIGFEVERWWEDGGEVGRVFEALEFMLGRNGGVDGEIETIEGSKGPVPSGIDKVWFEVSLQITLWVTSALSHEASTCDRGLVWKSNGNWGGCWHLRSDWLASWDPTWRILCLAFSITWACGDEFGECRNSIFCAENMELSFPISKIECFFLSWRFLGPMSSTRGLRGLWGLFSWITFDALICWSLLRATSALESGQST